MKYLRSFVCKSKTAAMAAGLVLVANFMSGTAKADVMEFFDNVAQPTTGEFVWDDFSGNYTDAHASQASSGIGSGAINVNEGGLVTSSSQNLYSFMSVATWTHNLSNLQEDHATNSLVIQVATTAALSEAQFSIAGGGPDEFIDLGNRTGGFNFYWAEWNDISASESLAITVNGTGQHQVLGGSKISYINSSSATNLSAVPEPSTFGLFALAGAFGFVSRRRKK